MKDFFGGDVSDEAILGEGAAAKTAKGSIEAAAAGIVGGEDFGGSFGARAVQVHADVGPGVLGQGCAHNLANQVRTRDTNGVGQ